MCRTQHTTPAMLKIMMYKKAVRQYIFAAFLLGENYAKA